jgi:CheY-like chemotaxis protein
MSELESPELRGRKVLVVDDDADNREMLATILEQSGAVVITAESSAAALSLFEREGADVLILDIGLPDEDGFGLLRKLRASRGGSGIPAIALTGYDTPEDRDQAHGEGFQAHLTKPVALAHVLAEVARVLRSA